MKLAEIFKDSNYKVNFFIKENFRFKKISEQLLELAKTAVEKAIEENEEAAIEFVYLAMGKLNLNI
jgi:type I restriction enzyme M protein